MSRTKKKRTSRKMRFETLETRQMLAGDLPLLGSGDFEHLGAIRVPLGNYGISQFAYGGNALAFNANDPNDPNDDTLFINGHVYQPGAVAEISIPTPVVSNVISNLPTATVVQNFADVSDGKIYQVQDTVRLGGLLVDNGQILWTAYDFYDANYNAAFSHGTSTLNLSLANDATGMFTVSNLNPGVVAGYMAHVPAAWQGDLGAPVLTGQSNLSIITRTSAGPTAVGFDPADLAAGIVPADPYLYYTVNDPLGPMSAQNPLFNFNSTVGGVVFPEGSSSVVYFGGHATGDFCYGEAADCNDPVRGGKGNHDDGGNYVYQAWAYDANDLVAVKNGTMDPWDVQPYAVWEPQFPTTVANALIGGVAYDPLTNRMFVVQMAGDPGNYESTPLIHVFQINASGEGEGSTAGFSVSESNGSTVVDESGTTDAFTVVLDAAPTSNVVFDVTSSDSTEAVVSLNSLTFTPANWNVPQTVNVTGVADNSSDGNQNIQVTVSVDDANSDDSFDALSDVNVAVTVVDVATGSFVIGDIHGGIAAQDGATGTGYIMYSRQRLDERFSDAPPTGGNSDHLIAVTHQGGQWYYDDNSVLRAFSPRRTDVLLATVDFSADTIQGLGGSVSEVHGMTLGYLDGDLTFLADHFGGGANDGEFTVQGTSFQVSADQSLTRHELGVVSSGIAAQPLATGAGYLMYSRQRVFDRFADAPPANGNSDHLIAVIRQGDAWFYDDGVNYQPFYPHNSDVLLASVDFAANTVTPLEGSFDRFDGIQAGYVGGDLTFYAEQWNGALQPGAFQVTGTHFLSPADQGLQQSSLGSLGAGIAARDTATGSGFILYSDMPLSERFPNTEFLQDSSDHLIAVVYQDGSWHFDDNASLQPFAPHARDVLIAEVNFTQSTVQSLKGVVGEHHGIKLGFSHGDLTFAADSWGGSANTGEFEVTGTHFDAVSDLHLTQFAAGILGGGIAARDNATEVGFLMYSAENLATRFAAKPPAAGGSEHFVPVTFLNGQWYYDTNSELAPFTPDTNDVLVAEVDFATDQVQSLKGFVGAYQGIERGFVEGDLVFHANQYGGVPNGGEFQIYGTFLKARVGQPLPNIRFDVGPLNAGIAARDGATGQGFLMYSNEALTTRFPASLVAGTSVHLIPVVYNAGQWYYDNNAHLVAFTPRESDVLLAEIDFTLDSIDSLENVLGEHEGIKMGYTSGDLVFTANMWGLHNNAGEFRVQGTHFYR